MKIVLDSNVILSAATTEGLSYIVFKNCLKQHEVFISDWIIAEVSRIARKKFKFTNFDVKELIEFLIRYFNLINPAGRIPNVCRDRDDNNILYLAEFCKADVIITGDSDLLVLKTFLNTSILTPREFYIKYLTE